MRAQATIEMLMLFATTILAIAIITQALLHSYDLAQKQSSAVRARALVENNIFMNEILCKSDIEPPRQLTHQNAIAKMKIEEWMIIVNADSAAQQNFSGIFVGCGKDAVFV